MKWICTRAHPTEVMFSSDNASLFSLGTNQKVGGGGGVGRSRRGVGRQIFDFAVGEGHVILLCHFCICSATPLPYVLTKLS